MRRFRAIATGRQQIILPLPDGELTFDLSATRRLRAVLGIPDETVGNVAVFTGTLGAMTLNATGDAPAVATAEIAFGAMALEADGTVVGAPLTQPILTGDADGLISVTDNLDGTGSVSFGASKPCKIYWGLYAEDSLSSDPSDAGTAIAAGTGALDFGTTTLTRGVNSVTINFGPGIDVTAGTFYVIARDETDTPNSDWSNVLKDTSVAVTTEGWQITTGNAQATIVSFPPVPTSPVWAVTAGNTQATVNTYPGQS